MGMDPVANTEVHEVTVQLVGRVSVTAYNSYKNLLRQFITDASNIHDAQYNNDLQVRVVREAVRPTNP